MAYKLTYTKRGGLEGLDTLAGDQHSRLRIVQILSSKPKRVLVRFTTRVRFTYPSPGRALGVLLGGERVARALALQKRCQLLPAANSTYTIKHRTVALPRTQAATRTRKPSTICKTSSDMPSRPRPTKVTKLNGSARNRKPLPEAAQQELEHNDYAAANGNVSQYFSLPN